MIRESDPTKIYLPILSLHFAERTVPLEGAMKTDKLEFEASYSST